MVHETVYQAGYRPELGRLHRELPKALRTGRRRRIPHRRGDERRGRLVDMTMIGQRPAKAEDRTVPGHWEGDLIIGELSRSAIGTLVERSSRVTNLLHLPGGRHTVGGKPLGVAAQPRDQRGFGNALIVVVAGRPPEPVAVLDRGSG